MSRLDAERIFIVIANVVAAVVAHHNQSEHTSAGNACARERFEMICFDYVIKIQQKEAAH